MRFGAIKVYAWRLLKGQPIPVFKDRRVNRAIDAHETRILNVRTRRPRPLKGTD